MVNDDLGRADLLGDGVVAGLSEVLCCDVDDVALVADIDAIFDYNTVLLCLHTTKLPRASPATEVFQINEHAALWLVAAKDATVLALDLQSIEFLFPYQRHVDG